MKKQRHLVYATVTLQQLRPVISILFLELQNRGWTRAWPEKGGVWLGYLWAIKVWQKNERFGCRQGIMVLSSTIWLLFSHYLCNAKMIYYEFPAAGSRQQELHSATALQCCLFATTDNYALSWFIIKCKNDAITNIISSCQTCLTALTCTNIISSSQLQLIHHCNLKINCTSFQCFKLNR